MQISSWTWKRHLSVSPLVSLTILVWCRHLFIMKIELLCDIVSFIFSLTPLLLLCCCFAFSQSFCFNFPSSASSALLPPYISPKTLLDNRPPCVVGYSSSVCLISSLISVCVVQRHKRSWVSQCILRESKYQTPPLRTQSQDTTLSAFICLLDLLPGLFTGSG